MIKSFFFCFIGLMLSPPWSLIGVGAALGLALLAVRWPTARLALRGAGFSKGSEAGGGLHAARYGGWRAGDPPGSGGYLRYASFPWWSLAAWWSRSSPLRWGCPS